MVVGIEKFDIQRLDRLQELVGCRRSLGVYLSKGCSKQRCKKKRLQRSKGLVHERILSARVYAVASTCGSAGLFHPAVEIYMVRCAPRHWKAFPRTKPRGQA